LELGEEGREEEKREKKANPMTGGSYMHRVFG
jgi:hypothetical protein